MDSTWGNLYPAPDCTKGLPLAMFIPKGQRNIHGALSAVPRNLCEIIRLG